jgi:hypothetical protein
MKKTTTSLLSLIVITGTVFSQGVAITGKVSDPNGVGLSGTVVRLATTALETQTDANGNYALGSARVNVRHFLTARAEAYNEPVLSPGKVLFTVTHDNARVRISVYDFGGRFVCDMLNDVLNGGNYSVALDGRNLASQPYVLNVNVNGASHSLKFTPFGAAGAFSTARTENTGSFAGLEKTMALNDTIKVTKPGYSIARQAADVSAGAYNFTLTKTSTWDGDTNTFWGDTSKYPKGTNGIMYVVLNKTNGQFPDSKICWSDQQGGTKVPITQQSTFNATDNGRFYVWVAPSDSGNRYFDFIEVNITTGTLSWYGNTTRVDGWRLPIAIRLHCSNGTDVTLGDSYEMFYQTRQAKFDEFKNEVPKEFIGLATHDFANIWAPHTSPVNYFNTNGPYTNYFSSYEDSVAAAQPNSPATTNAFNIFACAGGGTMGASPAFSSAINRHCGMLPQTAWSNDTNYYRAAPCNYFSKWCHRRALHNQCYGFPYDDFGGHAAYTGQSHIQWLLIAVGW